MLDMCCHSLRVSSSREWDPNNPTPDSVDARPFSFVVLAVAPAVTVDGTILVCNAVDLLAHGATQPGVYIARYPTFETVGCGEMWDAALAKCSPLWC